VSHQRSILLVTNDLGPRAGGIETFILGLIDQLVIAHRAGGQIVILTSTQPGSEKFDQDLMARTGVVVIRDRAKVLLPSPRVNRVAARIAREYGCTTVWFGAAMPLAWMAGHLKRAGVKNLLAITHGHEVWWSKLPVFRQIFKQSTKSLSHLTYLGEFTRSAMQGAVSKNCTMVQIAPGIPIDHFVPSQKSKELVAQYDLAGKKVVVCVGRLVHRKGQDKLIEAWPEVLESHPDAVLLLVGIGPREKFLRNQVATRGLSRQVRFVGRVAYNELPQYFSLGDLFAMPSRSRLAGLEVEGLGIVYLEASSSGIPVLAGRSGGAPDAVLQGITGEVVDGTDVKKIAALTSRMLSEPERLREMGAAGRVWAVEKWSWQIWGDKFAQLLGL